MTATDTYERLRLLLSPEGFATLPRHELTDKLLTNLYSEAEAELVTTCFEKFREKTSFEKICELTGQPEAEVSDMLQHMLETGKIRREGDTDYYMLAYLPGVFEDYFTVNRDDSEKMKKVAEAHRALQKVGFSPDTDFTQWEAVDFNSSAGWRFVPAIEPVSRILKVDESIDAERQIMPFEVLEKQLAKYDVFSVVKCSCRNMAELAGEPCQRTDEDFCFQAGPSAEGAIKSGIGRKLDYTEAMELLKRAAKAGLVHSTLNMQDTPTFICNCCSCCCGALRNIKDLKIRGGASRTNFAAVINHEECTLCETCIDMCPIEVMSIDADGAEESVTIDRDYCIGCGVCAANCPVEAISIEKTDDNIPVKSRPGLFGEPAQG